LGSVLGCDLDLTDRSSFAMLSSPAAPPTHSRILLVESDPVLAASISTDLRGIGYDAVVAPNTESCLGQLNQVQPALVVIDRLVSKDSGLDLCQRLRRLGARMPLLVMISDDSLADRINCLESGADDYFLKPYRTDTFLQFINLYLQPTGSRGEQLQFDSLVLDLETRRAKRNDRTIELTMKEFELLRYLMEHPRQVLNREQILENVWGYDFLGESNVIEVYIRYLRLKVEEEGEKRLIHTVRGVGYVLREA
jgi:two-component system, OmpR family, response regulator NblR